VRRAVSGGGGRQSAETTPYQKIQTAFGNLGRFLLEKLDKV